MREREHAHTSVCTAHATRSPGAAVSAAAISPALSFRAASLSSGCFSCCVHRRVREWLVLSGNHVREASWAEPQPNARGLEREDYKKSYAKTC